MLKREKQGEEAGSATEAGQSFRQITPLVKRSKQTAFTERYGRTFVNEIETAALGIQPRPKNSTIQREYENFPLLLTDMAPKCAVRPLRNSPKGCTKNVFSKSGTAPAVAKESAQQDETAKQMGTRTVKKLRSSFS